MNEKQHVVLGIVLFIAAVFFLSGFLYYQNHSQDKNDQLSTFDVIPNEAGPGQPSPEPVVTSWKGYTNEQYHFTLEVPAEWHVEDYAPAYLSGGTLVAFSPDPLPCNTCSYFRNGYFSVRVFNQKSDPEHYALFTQRAQAIGKSKEYLPVQLGQAKGVAFPNGVAAEHQGWVYELTLDTNEGKMQISDSKIFQRAVSSFEFTNLLFN